MASNLQAVVVKSVMPPMEGKIVRSVEERAKTAQKNQKRILDEGTPFVGQEVPIKLESPHLSGDTYFVDPSTLAVYRFPHSNDLPRDIAADNYVGRLFPGYHSEGGNPLVRVKGIAEDDEFMASHPGLDPWYARGEVNLWGFRWEDWYSLNPSEKRANGFVMEPDWAGVYAAFKAYKASGEKRLAVVEEPKKKVESLDKEKNLLHIPRSVPLNEKLLRHSYLRRALALHPDKNPGKDTTEAFKKVRAAYDTLLAALRT